MATHSLVAVVAAAGLFAPAAPKPPPGPSLTLKPSAVERGDVVVVTGSAGDCPVGDGVTILSRAFVHRHDFAGVPAVYARVDPGGLFRVATRIPRTKAAARYTVTARCGGGNLGVVKHLRVRR